MREADLLAEARGLVPIAANHLRTDDESVAWLHRADKATYDVTTAGWNRVRTS